MRTRSKLLLAALGALVVLSAGVTSASARSFSISNQSFRAVWRELTFSNAAQSLNVTCEVTLEGSFHYRTLVKSVGSLVGYVTRVNVNEGGCRGGTARALTGRLPWHIRYRGFRTALPNITGIDVGLIGAEFQLTLIGVNCLYRTTEERPAVGIITREARGAATSLTAEEGPTIPKSSGSGLCPSEGRFSGVTDTLTLLGTTQRITVTLI